MKKILLPAVAICLISVSCDRTRSSTGWDYMPDMYYSQAYETYTPNPNFADSMTMRVPVEGTVPRNMIPFGYTNREGEREAAGEELLNPLEATPESLTRGELAYHIYCESCHGNSGDGQGTLFTSQRYPYPPASLLSEQARALKDGEIYHSITVGYGIMGAHGSMIRPDDRWKIVLHIRENLQK